MAKEINYNKEIYIVEANNPNEATKVPEIHQNYSTTKILTR